MGCGSSSDIVAFPGFSEVLTIQAFTRHEFESQAALRLALAHVMELQRAEGAKDKHPPALETLAHRVTHDERPLKELKDAPAGLPAGSIKSNLQQVERVVARKVRPKVALAIMHTLPKKDHTQEEREAAAARAMDAAIHVCLMQEVFEFYAPGHFAAAGGGGNDRSIPLEDCNRAQEEAQPATHVDPAAGVEDGGGDDAGPESPPRDDAPRSATATPAKEPRDDVSEAPADSPPAASATKQQEPAAAAAAGPPTAAPAEGANEAPFEEELEELRYPLPEGDWIRSEDNADFYWSDEQGLFYFPAAGHFMDPESGMWYVAETDEWLAPEDHDVLLAEMAERGEY